MSEERATLSATLTGPDAPGTTAALMSAIAGLGTEILDFEQVVVRGQVTIAVLLGSLPDDMSHLEDRLAGTCARLGYRVEILEGMGDNRHAPSASSSRSSAAHCVPPTWRPSPARSPSTAATSTGSGASPAPR